MRWTEISEAPISLDYRGFNASPDETTSFDASDQRLAASEKARAKIKHLWRNSVVDVDAVMVNLRMEPTRAAYELEAGFISTAERVGDVYGITINPRPEAITVVFGQNEGTNKVPLTGWIMAHRMYHVFQGADWDSYAGGHAKFPKVRPFVRLADDILKETLNELPSMYRDDRRRTDAFSWLRNPEMNSLFAHAVLPTKAGRDGVLTNPEELLPEAFALYILRGKLKLNRLPDQLGDMTLRPHSRKLADDAVRILEETLVRAFSGLIEYAKGKVLVL